MGLAKSAHILTPSATVRRVFNMTAIAAVEAQIRAAGVPARASAIDAD
jgi:malate dehydrogenase (oxaloacetate-decarboxylating)(NADP+)